MKNKVKTELDFDSESSSNENSDSSSTDINDYINSIDDDTSHNITIKSGTNLVTHTNNPSNVTPIVTQKRFMDEDDTSDDSEEIINTRKFGLHIDILNLKYVFPNVEKYKFKTWTECFPDTKVNLLNLIDNPSWYPFFEMIEKKKYFKTIQNNLSNLLVKKVSIVPHAELLFNAFNVVFLEKIKVVIIGQDPYPGSKKINNVLIPEAMGFSFSVPMGYGCPKSLKNIYDNLYKYKHIRKLPKSGSLSFWALQGCFMINSSLTTTLGSRNAHRNIWTEFTQDLIEYINTKCTNIVFLVWGSSAHKICKSIDPKKHFIITSSHPSPMAYDSTMQGYEYGSFKHEDARKHVKYPPFNSVDHFGKINEYLKSVGKSEILWDSIGDY